MCECTSRLLRETALEETALWEAGFMVGVLLGGGSFDLNPWLSEEGLVGGGLLGGVFLEGGLSAMVRCDVYGRWRPNGGLLAT